ncbi:hypothetical protein [Lentibacillus sp. Marseille-P4043]
MIDFLKDQYPIKTLCEALGVSRSRYYDFKKRPNKKLLGSDPHCFKA